MLRIAQGAAAPLKQCSPTSPGLPALLGAPQGELRLSSTAKGRGCDRFCSCPLRRRAAQGATEKGRALSEPRRGELRSPRCNRAAQSTRRSRATQRARLLLGYFFLARQEEVPRRSTAKSSINSAQHCLKIPSVVPEKIVPAGWLQIQSLRTFRWPADCPRMSL